MTQFYKEEKDERGVVTVTLNRPQLHNAFNDVFIDQLIACFTSLSNVFKTFAIF